MYIKSSLAAAFLCFRVRLYTPGMNRAIRGLFGLSVAATRTRVDR